MPPAPHLVVPELPTRAVTVIWRLLAEATVVLNYGFLLYLIVGGFLVWRWPRTLLLHVAAAG